MMGVVTFEQSLLGILYTSVKSRCLRALWLIFEYVAGVEPHRMVQL